MKTFPLLLIISLLNCSSFFSHQLYAQQPAFNKKQNPSYYSTVHPWDTRAIDSMQKINDGRYFNRNSIQRQNKVRSFPGIKPGDRPYRLQKVTQNIPVNLQDKVYEKANTVCYTISGRNFLYQDSLLWPGNPSLTSDGNVIVSGEFVDYSVSPSEAGGFCMKQIMKAMSSGVSLLIVLQT